MIEYENGDTKYEFQFLALGVSEKAQWLADIAQVHIPVIDSYYNFTVQLIIVYSE